MESEKSCKGFNTSLNPYEERIRQHEEEIRRLKVKIARQGRRQRKKEISQKRRDAVNVRWRKESASAEASTPTESYKAANAVSAQSQNIVHGSERKALRKTYRPTHAQVVAFMQNRLKVRQCVAEEEAQSFLYYYNATDWEIRGTAITDWEACARNWVKKAERYNGKGIYEAQAPKEKTVTETGRQKREEKDNNGLVAIVAGRIRAGDYSETTGATALEVSEIMDKGIYPDDWKGELARKVCDFIRTETEAAPTTPTESYSVANAETYSVPNTESYSVVNAVSTETQIVVPYTAQDTARKTYIPTETQVCEYMQSYFRLPKAVAEEEARKLFDYYSASGWTMKGAPIADWEACVRNWVNRAVMYMDKQQRQQYERTKNYLNAIRAIEEEAEYKRIHGEEELPF